MSMSTGTQVDRAALQAKIANRDSLTEQLEARGQKLREIDEHRRHSLRQLDEAARIAGYWYDRVRRELDELEPARQALIESCGDESIQRQLKALHKRLANEFVDREGNPILGSIKFKLKQAESVGDEQDAAVHQAEYGKVAEALASIRQQISQLEEQAIAWSPEVAEEEAKL
jgi:hypothetical protein